MRRDERRSDHPVSDEDIIMGIAALAYREKINKELDELANDTSAPDLSPETIERLHNNVMRGFERLRKKNERKRRARRNRILVVCMAVFIVIGTGCAYSARLAIFNYVIKHFEQYSEIHYDSQSQAEPPIGWESSYYPTWLPEGTKVLRIQIEDGQNHYISYEDKDGYEFQFYVFSNKSQIPAYDTENMEHKEINISGYIAIFSCDNARGINTLTIPMEEQVLMIRGRVSESDIIQMAEKIKLS